MWLAWAQLHAVRPLELRGLSACTGDVSCPQLLAELCRQAFVPIIGDDHDVIFRAGDNVRISAAQRG